MRHFSLTARVVVSLVCLCAAIPVSAEPAQCLSPTPSDWPAPAKPYFMVIVDTSASMGTSVTSGSNSCGYQHNRIGDARCAVKNLINSFAGVANFGLATYAWRLNCPSGTAACANCDQTTGCFNLPTCSAAFASNDDGFCGPLVAEPTLGAKVHAGGLVAVPVLQDSYWAVPPPADNFSALYALLDDTCGNGEVGAYSNTPLGGALFSMNKYFSGTYVDPLTSAALPTPIGPALFGGQPAERPCRSVNIILITDGDETCDGYDTGNYPNNEGLAVYEAQRLFSTGVTVSGQNFKVRTHVIGFAGGTTSALNNIAAAGGTTVSYSTSNETQLSQALSSIVSNAIKPERCNNADDNCNGCTDEGANHYCNVQATSCCTWKTPAQRTACGAAACQCCSWATPSERTACLAGYTASITTSNPVGNKALLPCTTASQAQSPTSWLCFDPGDVCDNVDNNCLGGVDEQQLKCGQPSHCPTPETCNGRDDNCNGAVDEGNVCQGSCSVAPSTESCDGCDNDCDGVVDNGLNASIPCGPAPGPTTPAYCQGVISCKPAQSVAPGSCVPNGGYTACTVSQPPQAENCNGLDDDCDGIADNNVLSSSCVPVGAPSGLVFGGNSACRMGTTTCVNGATTCTGFVGPTAELCDGIDNNCDGTVDNNVSGVGVACGTNVGPCSVGTTACLSGALVCSGGVNPQPERCDGVDNDCNGSIDDGVLADAPAPGQSGCWQLPGNACVFNSPTNPITWAPPPGATCTGVGSLALPCSAGTLSCASGSWVCTGGQAPTTESCDGLDNDCNGQVDDGALPGVGVTCGSNEGECSEGVTVCGNGQVVCNSPSRPSVEVCDGVDNDCNGAVDDNLPGGGDCVMPYDATLYPGPRTQGACAMGVSTCDQSGTTQCRGGVAPSPELCDGIDNDCNGVVDDVTTGSDPKVGSACNVPMEQPPCRAGTFSCLGGEYVCQGSLGPFAEVCDGVDNDCDGTADDGATCPSGTDCVSGNCYTTCDATSATPCGGGSLCLDGHCTPSECDCGACQRCTNGKCSDVCADITCPSGWSCECGACVQSAPADAGTGTPGKGTGCGCSAGEGLAGGWWVLMSLAWASRRRAQHERKG